MVSRTDVITQRVRRVAVTIHTMERVVDSHPESDLLAGTRVNEYRIGRHFVKYLSFLTPQRCRVWRRLTRRYPYNLIVTTNRIAWNSIRFEVIVVMPSCTQRHHGVALCSGAIVNFPLQHFGAIVNRLELPRYRIVLTQVSTFGMSSRGLYL